MDFTVNFYSTLNNDNHLHTRLVQPKFNVWASLSLITIISLLATDRSIDLTSHYLAEPNSRLARVSVGQFWPYICMFVQPSAIACCDCDNVLESIYKPQWEQGLLPDIRRLSFIGMTTPCFSRNRWSVGTPFAPQGRLPAMYRMGQIIKPTWSTHNFAKY